MSNIVIDIAAEFTGKKGFTQADKATQQLSKGVKNLAKTFGLVFGLQGAKRAVSAFAADDKAARTLSKTLDNLGLAFADPATKIFIADLERQYGVLDDQLRPAFQKLITTTGDFKKSQDLLKTALDLSAMSGVDVVSVTDDLSKAYAGNTRGLIKYGLGISKAELATMNFDEILTQVAKVSGGQAQLAADTLAGSMAKLSVATANASESLGKDLIQALTTLGGSGGLPKTLGLIETIASAIGDALVGFSRLIQQINIITSSGSPIEMFKRLAAFRKEYQAQDAAQRLAEKGGGGFSSYQAKKAADALALKAAKALTAETKKTAAAELAKAKAKKDQAALDKAALALAKGEDVFDMDKIQINAALLSKQSEINKLGAEATDQQKLQVANDLVRLTIKRDMLLLEDAIAAKDVAGATALAAKLNKDLAILAVLQGQNIKLLQINDILEAFKPKDLINLANLNEALRLLMAMAGVKISPLTGGTGGTGGSGGGGGGGKGKGTGSLITGDFIQPLDKTTLLAGSIDALLEYADAATARANAMADLLDYQLQLDIADYNASEAAKYGGQLGMQNGTVVNISAGVIASPDEFARMVQKAVQNANRFGNNLDYAGGL